MIVPIRKILLTPYYRYRYVKCTIIYSATRSLPRKYLIILKNGHVKTNYKDTPLLMSRPCPLLADPLQVTLTAWLQTGKT